jgi:type II secretory pathway component PulF
MQRPPNPCLTYRWSSMSSRYFHARYLTRDGQDVGRMFFVRSQQDVRREVAQLNGVIQSITEHRRAWFNREYYSREYKLAFLKGLLFHIDVGVSAGQGLMYLIEAEANASKRAEMQAALEVLARGGRFADAIAALPFMDKAIVVLLQTADATGSINEAISDAIGVVETRKVAWKAAAAAISWLSFDLSTVVSTVFGIQFYAIPWFRDHPPGIQDPVRNAEYASELARIASASLWMTVGTVVLTVLFIAFGAALFWGSTGVKDRLHQRIVRLPALRGVFIDGALSDGFLLMSRMVKSGVPISRALDLLTGFSWIHSITQFWRTVQQSLNQGWDPKHAFQSGNLLTTQELIALSSYQNRDQLSKVMASMAARRSDMAEMGTRRFIRISVVVTLVYMILVMSLVFWLLSLQNLGLTGSFDELIKGGY